MFDLPIALGTLAATGHLNQQLDVLGELALNGGLRPVKGVLPATMVVARTDKALLLPGESASDAALVQSLSVRHARHVADVVAAFNSGKALPVAEARTEAISYRQMDRWS